MSILQVVLICMAVNFCSGLVAMLFIYLAWRWWNCHSKFEADVKAKLNCAHDEEKTVRGRCEDNKDKPYTVTLDESGLGHGAIAEPVEMEK